MGWYAGSLGRLVWTSRRLPGSRQADGVLAGATNTVTAPWRRSLTVTTSGWDPGWYLLRLDSATGAQRFVPITVRQPSARDRVVLVNAVTTWQAYNQWGGYDLYQGPTGSFGSRARAVAFDRPYDNQFSMRFGAGEFLHRELPVLALAERLGLALDYVTDIDLHIHRSLRRAVVDRGADEQLLHGEPHAGNLLRTTGGMRFIDLETCCYGPVEFDIAHAPDEVGDHYALADPLLLRDCRILMLAMVAAWRADRDDDFPNGRTERDALLSMIRQANRPKGHS